MTLGDAFEGLGLRPPLEFEADILNRVPAPATRQIGTTTRMLVMATLDLHAGHHVYVRMAHKSQETLARNHLHRFANRLDLDPTWADRLTISTAHAPSNSNSHLVVYVDHLRDILDSLDWRVPGPLGLTRYAEASQEGYKLFDSDGTCLGEVTRRGFHTLCERHFLTARMILRSR